MKKNILIISAVMLAISAQLTAKDVPATNEKSPILVKKKSDLFLKDDAPASSSKNIFKINLTQLALTNFSLQYEHGFHKNLSVALGVSYLMPRTIPSEIYKPSANGEGYQLPKFGGWSVTPEIRFYPGKKIAHKAPHGFYLAPYFRYSKYSLNSSYVDVDSVSGNRNNYDVKASYAGFTAGLMIGSQWLIGKHFSIDWWIIGGGAGKAKFDINSVSTDGKLNMSQQEQADLKTDIKSNIGELGSFGNGNITVETTNNSATAKVTGLPMTSIRGFGLTLGFTF